MSEPTWSELDGAAPMKSFPHGGDGLELIRTRPLVEFSGPELAALTDDDLRLDWLPMLGQPGWLVVGWSHLLSGYPKAGKTELLLRQVRSWLTDHKVLILSEESRQVWALRLRGLGGHWAGLQVVCGLGAEPELLLERAVTGTEDIVVVDTVRNLLRLEDEKDNSEVARVVNPWVSAMRDEDKTLFMAHHQRKGGGEHGEGITGGHALLGVFDIAVELKFDQLHPNRRILQSLPRLVDPQELVYEKRGLELVVLGDPGELGLEELCERMIAFLSDTPQPTKALRESLGDPVPSPEQVRRALNHLAQTGRALRDPDIELGNVHGKTIRWSCPQPNFPRGNAVGSEVVTRPNAGSVARSLETPQTSLLTEPPKGEVPQEGEVLGVAPWLLAADESIRLWVAKPNGHRRPDAGRSALHWPAVLTAHGSDVEVAG